MSDVKDLQANALNACHRIYELFDEIEIKEQLTPIRDAWWVGEQILYKNNKGDEL